MSFKKNWKKLQSGRKIVLKKHIENEFNLYLCRIKHQIIIKNTVDNYAVQQKTHVI